MRFIVANDETGAMVIPKMDDPTVVFLKGEIAKAEAHARKLRNTLATYLGESEPKQSEFPTVHAVSGDLSGKSQPEAAYCVLSESAIPLNYEEIISLTKDRGKILNPTSLPSVLSRKKEMFRHVGGGRWTIASATVASVA